MAGYHSEYEKSLKEARDEIKIEIEKFEKIEHSEDEDINNLLKAIDTYAEKTRKAVSAFEAAKLKAQEKASGIFENSNKIGGLN